MMNNMNKELQEQLQKKLNRLLREVRISAFLRGMVAGATLALIACLVGANL